MPFDPDAYLAGTSVLDSFDPDEYLKATAPAKADLRTGFDTSLDLRDIGGDATVAIGGLGDTEAMQFDTATGRMVPIYRALPVTARRNGVPLDTEGVDPYAERNPQEREWTTGYGVVPPDDVPLEVLNAYQQQEIERNAGGNIPEALQPIDSAIRRGTARGRQARAMVSGDAETIAEAQREIAKHPHSPAMERFNNSRGAGEMFQALADDPLTIFGELTAESMASFLPTWARKIPAHVGTGAAVGAAGGAPILGAGALPGAALGAQAGMITSSGAASYELEAAGKIIETLQEHGVDVKNAEALAAAFGNDELMGKAREAAARKGIPIALLDGISAGLAGRLVGMPGLTVGRKILAGGREMGEQMALGGGGEALGQRIAGEEFNLPAVAAEVLGEGPSSVGEIAGGAIRARIAPEARRMPASVPQPPVPTTDTQRASDAELDEAFARFREWRESAASAPEGLSRAMRRFVSDTPQQAQRGEDADVDVEPEVLRQTTPEYERELESEADIGPDVEAERQARAEMERELREESESWQAGHGHELLEAIAESGGLPAKGSPYFSQEIEPLIEEARNPERRERIQYNRVFSTSAPDMDELATRLRDRGFNFETGDEVKQAVQDRIRTGKRVYGLSETVPFKRQENEQDPGQTVLPFEDGNATEVRREETAGRQGTSAETESSPVPALRRRAATRWQAVTETRRKLARAIRDRTTDDALASAGLTTERERDHARRELQRYASDSDMGRSIASQSRPWEPIYSPDFDRAPDEYRRAARVARDVAVEVQRELGITPEDVYFNRGSIDPRTRQRYSLPDEIREAAAPSTDLEERAAVRTFSQAIERDPARRARRARRRDNARLESVRFAAHLAASHRDVAGAELIVRAHGHRPVWFRNLSGESVNGAIMGRNVFLNVDSITDPIHHTAAHEITHAMEREAPDVYRAFEEVIVRESQGRRRDYLANRLGRGYERKELRRELVADFVGETIEDPRQLQELLRDNPSLLQRVATFILDFLDRIKRALANLPGDTASARDTIRDLDAAQRAMREAFRQYRQRYQIGNINPRRTGAQLARSGSQDGRLARYRTLAGKRDDGTITAAESRELENVEREQGQSFLPMDDAPATAAPDRPKTPAPQFRGATTAEDVDGGLDLGLFEDEAGQRAFFKREESTSTTGTSELFTGPRIRGRLTRFFYEGARDVFDRTPGLKFLGDAIRKHVDQTRKYDGEMSYPYRAWERRHDRKARRQALSDFESYWGEMAVRPDNANRFLATYPPASKELIQLWRETAKYADERNEGMTVYDDAIKAYRPIGTVKDYFPRTIRPAVWDMLERASKAADREEWNNLVADLISEGTVKDEAEAVSYVDRALKPLRRFSYLGNIEAARGLPLPNRAYDYSFAAARRYMRAWAERRAQVEAFGQKLGKSGKDLFDVAMDKTRDRATRRYIEAVQKRAYNEVPDNAFHRTAAFLNALATPLHLANPKTLQRNILSGLVYNQATFGTGPAIRAAWEMRKAHEAIDDAYARGVLNDDLMNMLHDAEQLGSKALSKVQRGSDKAFRLTGYRLSEDLVRAHAMLTAKAFLRQAVQAFNANPRSSKAMRYAAHLKRNGHNVAKLAAERGEGELTDRFLRESVNLAQGGYRYDQVPLFTDTPIGRFLFKYQKWSTMATRNFVRNVLTPAINGTDLTLVRDGERVTVKVREFQPLTRYVIALLLSGQAILGLEELLFGTTPGFASIEEVIRTWDDDKKRALEIALGRAWKGILAVGGFGILGNYTQHFMDVTERRRAHNPMTPPALGSLIGIKDLAMAGVEQGKLTGRDLDNFVNSQVSAYRTAKDIGARLGETMGVSAEWQRVESADHDARWLNTITRRYADEIGEPSKRTAPGRVAKTRHTPFDENLREALLLGDVQGVRSLLREQLSDLSPAQREAFLKSVKASVRARQPIRVGYGGGERRVLFLNWARERLPKEELQRVGRIDATYRKTAQAAGLMPAESKPVDLEAALRKQQLRRALSD